MPERAPVTRDQWAARIAALDAPRRATRARKPPITVERIVEAAFGLVAAEGYDALTMRRVATALETGPASLYAHVRDKAELDDLLIGELCAQVTLPEADPVRWREQFLDVCRQLRDQYLRYPGISGAALSTAPHGLDALRLNEGLLAILLAGGVAPRSAAWAIDAAFLYVGAYSLEASLRRHADASTDQRLLDRDEVVARFRMLPADRFPNVVAHADELAAGEGHERFDFTLELLLAGLDR
ncbi:TetR family transcriptional regulator [Actinomycetospora succinea]|uniref:TetR family transcriptional regulator n=1 Tax=Actinomycetospora succinea TaxID=663603 RepID=A0A4R6VEE2_9PSEU|nr:TetR/AcrR family transcriptional regulator [Actinomycetospora succinea]TDQ58810.1 TetR family transcriptional regulator [Actinomycetospora succinea]